MKKDIKDIVNSKGMFILLSILITFVFIYISVPHFFQREKIEALVERMNVFEKNS